MSVKNLDLTAQVIGNWISEQVAAADLKGAVVGLSGGADSALVALLCKRAGIPLTCVLMPCGSSQSSLDRANELAEKHGLKTVKVNLEAAFNSIVDQLEGQLVSAVPENASKGALRSCLRAPTLDYVGKMTQSLIIGTGNRDEDEVTRYFQKRGDGCVDCSPIARLHKSEVYELLKFLGCTQAIIDAVPSADLWGPESGQADEKELGISYQEVEWGVRQLNDKQTVRFEELTQRQFEVLQKLIKMERASKHKAQTPPVLDVRNPALGLVD